MKEQNWSIQECWNLALISGKKDRRIEPRNILFASEIGKNFLEVYWQMKGIPPTNVASDTALRKMEAGNFYEAIVAWTLQRCGILKETQGKARLLNDPNYLDVYGRFDILAGHDGNWLKTKTELEEMFKKFEELKFDFPFYIQVKKIALQTVEYLSSKYPEGLSDKIYEVKSINSMAFWREDKPISSPYPHHVMQLSFYQMIHPVKIASFIYIDRDTMSISEIPNFLKKENTDTIYAWLKQMTDYWRNQTEPEKPPLIIWDKKENKWSFNWEIDRSQYRDKLLGSRTTQDIRKEVNDRNYKIRKENALDSALEGKEIRGNKKYRLAIEYIKSGITEENIIKKTKITKNEFDIIKQRSIKT